MGTRSFGDELSELSRVADEAAQVYRAVYGSPSAPDAPASGAPATEPRRTVGAVVRDAYSGDAYSGIDFIVVSPGSTRRLSGRPNPTMPGLDRDTFVRWATREECERHGIPYVARPLPGAPLAAPSRPEWVRITGPEDAEDVTIGKAYRVLGWTDVRGGRPSITNDAGVEWVCAGPNEDGHDTLPKWEPCAAPSPAATPAGYVPKVGDVVGIDGGNDYGETRVVTAVGARVTYARLNSVGAWLCEHTMDVSLLTYLRPATAAERAAAGLPVDESAVDAPAFDEAKEREAARVAWATDTDLSESRSDNFIAGWLARARVAAKGGAK